MELDEEKLKEIIWDVVEKSKADFFMSHILSHKQGLVRCPYCNKTLSELIEDKVSYVIKKMKELEQAQKTTTKK